MKITIEIPNSNPITEKQTELLLKKVAALSLKEQSILQEMLQYKEVLLKIKKNESLLKKFI